MTPAASGNWRSPCHRDATAASGKHCPCPATIATSERVLSLEQHIFILAVVFAGEIPNRSHHRQRREGCP